MRLIFQFCLLLLVLLSTATHALGKMAVGQNIASGGYGVVYVDCTSADAPPTLINAGEAAPWGYELASDVRDGPNVYAYVKQNPWTAFDPEGLFPAFLFDMPAMPAVRGMIEVGELVRPATTEVVVPRTATVPRPPVSPPPPAATPKPQAANPPAQTPSQKFTPNPTEITYTDPTIIPKPAPTAAPTQTEQETKKENDNKVRFFRGSKPGTPVSFAPRPNFDYKVDSDGHVAPTHGISVFDNPNSVMSKGYVPYEVDNTSVSPSLQIIQRGKDPHHYEITPSPGAQLTPPQYADELKKIRTKK